MELVVSAGALNTLVALLESEEVEHSVQAAAAQALGAIIKDEHMATEAIPILVKMMCSNVTQVSPCSLPSSRLLQAPPPPSPGGNHCSPPFFLSFSHSGCPALHLHPAQQDTDVELSARKMRIRV